MGLLRSARAFVWRLGANRYKTMFGKARIYSIPWEETRVRVLDIDGTYQSATYLDHRWCEVPFPYLRLYDCVFEGKKPAQNVCMLGGGGYAFPKHVIAHRPYARIDVVEVDPAITRIARQHFFLDRLIKEYGTDESGRLGLVCDDAYTYLKEAARRGKTYDAILNDCFAAINPEATLATPQGLSTIERCLTPQGLYLTNVITALEGENARPLVSLTKLLSCEFSHVLALSCDRARPDEQDNVVVVASRRALHLQNGLNLYDEL